MKIIVCTTNDVFAGIVLYKLFRERAKDIQAVFLAEHPMAKKHPLALFLSVSKISGLRYALYLASELLLYRLIAFLRTLFGLNREPNHYMELPTKLARRYGIPIYKRQNFRASRTISLLKQLSPHLLVSVRCGYVFQKQLLEIPAIGTVNFHASLLPRYAGLASVFHAVLAQEPYLGITVHWMNEALDSGGIILQEKIPYTPRESLSAIYFRCHLRGAVLVENALDRITRDALSPSLDVVRTSYYSWPTRKEVASFKKQGYKFFKLADLCKVFFSFSYE